MELSSSSYQIGKPQEVRLKCTVANNSDPVKGNIYQPESPDTIYELHLRLNQKSSVKEGHFRPSDDWARKAKFSECPCHGSPAAPISSTPTIDKPAPTVSHTWASHGAKPKI